MTTIYVYLLSSADCSEIYSINSKYNKGPQLIVCDYGSGNCVEKDVIDNPTYAEWRNALEIAEPFSSRTVTEVIIDDPFGF